jgi:hypothetical protein
VATGQGGGEGAVLSSVRSIWIVASAGATSRPERKVARWAAPRFRSIGWPAAFGGHILVRAIPAVGGGGHVRKRRATHLARRDPTIERTTPPVDQATTAIERTTPAVEAAHPAPCRVAFFNCRVRRFNCRVRSVNCRARSFNVVVTRFNCRGRSFNCRAHLFNCRDRFVKPLPVRAEAPVGVSTPGVSRLCAGIAPPCLRASVSKGHKQCLWFPYGAQSPRTVSG